MHNSKLLILCHTLSDIEWKRLQKFLNSPYFNENKQLVQLAKYINKHIRKTQKQHLSKVQVFKHLYKKEAYNDLRIRQLMYKLFRLIEQFLRCEHYKVNKIEQALHTSEIYLKRQLPKHFTSSLNNTKQLLTQTPHANNNHLYYNYYAEQLQSNYLQWQQDRKQEPNLQAVSDSLDTFYLFTKFKHSCAMMSYQNMAKVAYNLDTLYELLTLKSTNSYQKSNPAVSVYYHALLALHHNDNELHFSHFKQLLLLPTPILPHSEMRDLHALARNYCIKKINEGHQQYIDSLFDLYQIALQCQFLMTDQVLSPWTYINISALGLRLNKFTWTKQFIIDYQERLVITYQQDAYNFALAQWHFARQQYHAVISLLAQTEITDVLLNLTSKTLLLKTYYELNEYAPLESLLDSFRIFVLRKKGLGYHKQNYLNMIRFTKHLVFINNYDTSKLEKLKLKIIDTKVVAEKKWLLQKVQLLQTSS